MPTPSVTLQRATAADCDRIESVLARNDLPHADVRDRPGSFFLAHDDGAFVGLGGVERYGSAGLLRSVVVVERFRGRGYGSALCDELEERAAAEGVERLYLLTTTAAPFFRDRGYETRAREAVPSAVRGTTEFAELCPASAVCLAKTVDRAALSRRRCPR